MRVRLVAAGIAVLALAGCGGSVAASGHSGQSGQSATSKTFKDKDGYTCPASQVTIYDGFSYCLANTANPAAQSQAPEPTQPIKSAPTVQQIASQIGATNVQEDSDPTLYATNEGSATWHGRSVDIATFETTDLRNKWETIAREFGPILIDGPNWAVTTR
jgi:hypothetical protein